MTKVGEVMSPRMSSPWPTPWVKVVLPAPSSPLSTTRSPAASCPASARPISRIDSASGASNRKVRNGRRSSTLGEARRISRKPWRSQNRRVRGSSSRVTTVRSSKPWAASTAASISTLAMPWPWAFGSTPKRRRYMVLPLGSSTSAPTSSPSNRATRPPAPFASSAASSVRLSLRAAAGGSSSGRASKAGSTTARTSSAPSGPTWRISRLTGSPPALPPRRSAGRARR